MIFLVVFNHIIAFQLVKVNPVVRQLWYAITVFHMPAFIFVSGFLSKSKQNVLKNIQNLLVPYILGYSFTWAVKVWLGYNMDYDILRPSGTVMWYVLALFVYRLIIEAFGRIRFIVPLSIIFSLWAGTRNEFSTYLSASRIVVFFPFFVAGYLWKSQYITVLRNFRRKWILMSLTLILLYLMTAYMLGNNLPVDIFRGNHSYRASNISEMEGMLIRLFTYLASFLMIISLLAIIPDRNLFLTFIGSGRRTMGIYFFHYPMQIAMNSFQILKIPLLLNVGSLFLISLLMVLILGSVPVNWAYNHVLRLINIMFFKEKAWCTDE